MLENGPSPTPEHAELQLPERGPCTVQGNDHYDTDYAPCSGCRETVEAIAKEADDA